jgi:hypothetical protein
VFSFKPKTDTSIKELIDVAYTQLYSLEVDTPEYDKVLNQIERLHKLSSREKEGYKVSPDVLVTVLANLAGILLILNYERMQIVTSKALSFVIKTKV